MADILPLSPCPPTFAESFNTKMVPIKKQTIDKDMLVVSMSREQKPAEKPLLPAGAEFLNAPVPQLWVLSCHCVLSLSPWFPFAGDTSMHLSLPQTHQVIPTGYARKQGVVFPTHFRTTSYIATYLIAHFYLEEVVGSCKVSTERYDTLYPVFPWLCLHEHSHTTVAMWGPCVVLSSFPHHMSSEMQHCFTVMQISCCPFGCNFPWLSLPLVIMDLSFKCSSWILKRNYQKGGGVRESTGVKMILIQRADLSSFPSTAKVPQFLPGVISWVLSQDKALSTIWVMTFLSSGDDEWYRVGLAWETPCGSLSYSDHRWKLLNGSYSLES